MASTSSTLNCSPMSEKTRLASARDHTSLVKGLSRAMISRIFFSIFGEILRRERLVAEEIVIEAVVDHRADGDLRAGPQCLHRFGEHMRGIVANKFERARVVAGEELDFGVVVDRIGKIGELAVERHRHRALGKRRRNALGDVEAGGVLRILPTCAVGKGQGDHASLLLLTRCLRTQVSVSDLFTVPRRRGKWGSSFAGIDRPECCAGEPVDFDALLFHASGVLIVYTEQRAFQTGAKHLKQSPCPLSNLPASSMMNTARQRSRERPTGSHFVARLRFIGAGMPDIAVLWSPHNTHFPGNPVIVPANLS